MSINIPRKFQEHWKQGRLLNRASNITNFLASLRCHGDCDWNKTQIIINFDHYIIQLWQPLPHIFTHADVLNAQTWEVSPPKNPVEPPLRYTTFIVVARFLISKFLPESKHKLRSKFVTVENSRWHSLCSDFRSITSFYS